MSGKVIVAVFPSRDLLSNALDHITELRDVVVRRAAIVAHAASGETVILDDNISPNDGGFVGSIVGGILGALFMAQQGALRLPDQQAGTILALGFVLGAMIGAPVAWFVVDRFKSVSNKAQSYLSLVPEMPTGRPALILEIKRDDAMHSRLLQELDQFQAEFLPTAA